MGPGLLRTDQRGIGRPGGRLNVGCPTSQTQYSKELVRLEPPRTRSRPKDRKLNAMGRADGQSSIYYRKPS